MNWEHTEIFKIRGYEVDADNKVPVQSCCAFMEEAAGNHAAGLGFGVDYLQERGLTWVLARMQLEVYGLPEAGDEVFVTTWPVEVERLQFRRDFIIGDGRGREFVRAVTDWVIIDLSSRRLLKIPEFIAAHQAPGAPRALNKEKPRIEGQESAPELKTFTVRKADIDRNRHVNNVRFSDWMLEATPDEVCGGKSLRAMQIVYRAEAVYGDAVVARGSRGPGEGEFLHGLYRDSDGRELVRARSVWREAAATPGPGKNL